MKLPDINYGNVETLGRQDPALRGSATLAPGLVFAQATETGIRIGEELYTLDAVEEYTRLDGEMKKDLTDLEYTLQSKAAFSPDEIPDFVDILSGIDNQTALQDRVEHLG